jgi:hypothetical protein
MSTEPVRDSSSSVSGPLATGSILGSSVALTGRLVAAQVRLINSYLRLATPAAAARHQEGESAPAPTTDSVEARAYEIFVQRGDQPGDPVDDWRRAEAELRGE